MLDLVTVLIKTYHKKVALHIPNIQSGCIQCFEFMLDWIPQSMSNSTAFAPQCKCHFLDDCVLFFFFFLRERFIWKGGIAVKFAFSVFIPPLLTSIIDEATGGIGCSSFPLSPPLTTHQQDGDNWLFCSIVCISSGQEQTWENAFRQYSLI